MFSRRAPHRRSGSNFSTNVPTAAAVPSSSAHAHAHAKSNSSSVEPPLVSPLQMTFDFELDVPPPSSPSGSLPPFSPIVEPPPRPKTSHGLMQETGGKGKGLQPPMLPPIPRVASQTNSTRSRSNSIESEEHNAKSNGSRARDESDNFSSTSKKNNALKARLSFEHPVELMPPLSRPNTAGGSAVPDRPQTAGGASSNYSTPKMESSLFPSRNDSPAVPQLSNAAVMNRQFIDSRDKPYSQPPPKPFALQHNHSSPNLLGPQSASAKPAPMNSSSRTWTSPQTSMQNLSQKSNFSGSTARPSTQASTFTAHSASPTVTIGTPYNATADSFPLPQLVKTRPKTPGQTATVAGVSVPTHYTHGSKTTEVPKESKRKTRLLNPLALLQRRRSNQDPELAVEERSQRQAQAQALARQRDVVTSGVYKPPPDFDPRIKGKVVHDFSAPRRNRNTFDEVDMPVSPYGIAGSSAVPTPATPGYPPRNASLSNRDIMAESSQRRSTHTPVFVEHLSENPEGARRISSIQAENLENKDFLQRASKHSSITTYSQESAVLPPFARRSQTLDPLQASFYNDDESKSSSEPSSDKERHSNLSSSSQISPVTARSSHQNVDVRPSFSPISPSSPGMVSQQGADAIKTPLQTRPVSDISGVPSQDDSHRPMSEVSKVSSLDKQSKHLSEVTARPYSVILAPPAINTVAEGSTENSPIDAPRQGSSLEPQVLTRGVSYRSSGNSSPAQATGLQPLPGRSANASPASQSLLERTAGMATPDQTPEPELVESIQFKPTKDQPKLVEKRASAVGHSRKSSNVPKHHPSNASRFSFQYGTESAAQEQALEEKHRKMRSTEIAQAVPRGRSPDEDDEDDYFDEDAMDDMDEMEMQASEQQSSSADQLSLPAQSSLYLQRARQALQQHDSDDDSVYDDEMPHVTSEEELPYPDHPAFRTHSALWNDSRHNSYQPSDDYWRGSTIDHYMRDSYMPSQHSRVPSASSGLGIDTSNAVLNTSGGQQGEHLSPHDNVPGANAASRPRSTYMPPKATDHSPTTQTHDERPPAIPDRNSGNSERNRAASGMSFAAPTCAKMATSAAIDEEPASSEKAHHISDMSYSSVSDDARSSRAAHSSANVTAAGLSRDSGASDRSGGMDLASPLSSPQFEDGGSAGREDDKFGRNDSAGDTVSLASPTKGTRSVNTHGKNTSMGNISLASPTRTFYDEEDFNSDDAISLASPAKASSHGTGKHSGSRDTHLVELPSTRVLGHQSNASGMSFEDFARDGFSRVGSPTSESENPKRKELSVVTPSSTGQSNARASDTEARPTGLGVSMFAGFDFEDGTPFAMPGNGISDAEENAGSPHAIGSPAAVRQRQQSFGQTLNGPRSTLQTLDSPLSADDSRNVPSVTTGPSTFAGFDFGNQPGPLQNPVSGAAGLNPFSDFDFGNSNFNGASARSKTTSPVPSAAMTQPSKLTTGPTAPPVSSPQPARSKMTYDSIGDDMYFDDGNFAADINGSHGESIDENAFDDDAFLARPGMSNGGVNHRRDRSSAALTVNSLGSDGPYPSFAVPNAARASARLSQMMLEDLPLREPNDPKFIPQRNPSEDMKRLGMSKTVPPVPVPETDKDAFNRMQSSLQSYHATLAEAANRAAAEGRFLRAPSTATSVSSKVVEDNKSQYSQDDRSVYDDKSMYSNDESGGEIVMPYTNSKGALDRSNTSASHLTHMTNYSPPKMSFDFGFDESMNDDFDDGGSFGNDDDLVAAANAEVLASDDAGFYGQEFGFYGRPRANSGDLEAINGGFFGQDGDDGLMRNKSLKEPNLTPITERSEFSTRNSFIGLGMAGAFGPASASAYGPHSPALARMPMTPLYDTEVTSFDELRRLKANAFSGAGGSTSSLHSHSNRSSQHSLQAAFSPTLNTRPQVASPQGYFGAAPMQFGYSTDSNGSNSNPNSARPISNPNQQHYADSPRSTASSNGLPFAMDVDATPKRNANAAEPVTARKMPPQPHSMSSTNGKTHSRNGSGADSVTYVREPDPENLGKPRWVLERRRTSEQGNLELIGRELVQGGWI